MTARERVRSKVLVTGATGFIGGAVLKALAVDGHDVVGTARRPVPGAHAFVHVPDIGPDTDWNAALAGVDTVVHLAARVHRRPMGSADELAAHRRINRDGTARLAEAAERAGVSAFVFLSTIAVVGELSEVPINEATPCAPATPYAVSKLEAEQIVRGLPRLRVVVLRAPMVYGTNAPGNFSRLVRAVRSGVPLPFKGVRNRRSFVAAENLAAALVCAVENSNMSGLYHVADDGGVSTPQFITMIADALGRPARLVGVPGWLLQRTLRAVGGQSLEHKLMRSLPIDARHLRSAGWQPQPTWKALHTCLS